MARFAIGSLVRIPLTEVVAGDMGPEAVGTLVVNELVGPWMGKDVYEVRNAEGESFTVLESALVEL